MLEQLVEIDLEELGYLVIYTFLNNSPIYPRHSAIHSKLVYHLLKIQQIFTCNIKKCYFKTLNHKVDFT